jgi:GGDEF domain-containing protein
MTMYSPPQLSVGDIAQSIGMLRQLEQQIEAVRQDFMTEGDGPHLPSEVTQFHLRRELVALERQIRDALVNAFGEHSRQVSRFRESGFVAATAARMNEGQVILDGFIFELEQKRLDLLETNGRPPLPGIDPVTDLYTEPMLRRYLEHEVAWSQRHGDPFGLLLLRLPTWPTLKTRADEDSIAKELVISMACVLKTSVRPYDFPCRLNGGEFGVLLRQITALDSAGVAQHVLTNFRVATRRKVPIEFTSASCPYDAESLEGLFAYAAKHWMRFEEEQEDQNKKSIAQANRRSDSNAIAQS